MTNNPSALRLEDALHVCECGCGQPTAVATYNSVRYGWIKGRPKRFLSGHNKRPTTLGYEIEHCGYITRCWIWKRRLTAGGYAECGITDGRTGLVHRRHWEDINGPVPKGLQLDHLCRNRACVNPDHLEAVTHAENDRRGRQAKLTPEQVVEIRQAIGTHGAVAARYGVGPTAIRNIRHGKTWRGV